MPHDVGSGDDEEEEVSLFVLMSGGMEERGKNQMRMLAERSSIA